MNFINATKFLVIAIIFSPVIYYLFVLSFMLAGLDKLLDRFGNTYLVSSLVLIVTLYIPILIGFYISWIKVYKTHAFPIRKVLFILLILFFYLEMNIVSGTASQALKHTIELSNEYGDSNRENIAKIKNLEGEIEDLKSELVFAKNDIFLVNHQRKYSVNKSPHTYSLDYKDYDGDYAYEFSIYNNLADTSFETEHKDSNFSDYPVNSSENIESFNVKTLKISNIEAPIVVVTLLTDQISLTGLYVPTKVIGTNAANYKEIEMIGWSGEKEENSQITNVDVTTDGKTIRWKTTVYEIIYTPYIDEQGNIEYKETSPNAENVYDDLPRID